jgi:tripartite-type tricarboxylate transporter receptor subunit TctC
MKLSLAIRHAVQLIVACAVFAPAQAQNWPTRQVRLVVPFAPGGGYDTMARLLTQKLTERIAGSSFIVDNRPGAGGIVGTELVARAAPDGYTLLVAGTEFTANPGLRSKLPFDPVKDFAPISQLTNAPFLLASHVSVPVKNVKDVIVLAKARPGQLTCGSSGPGGGPHLTGELFRSMAGIRWVHVPFKGAQPATIALIGGEIDFLFAATTSLVPHVRSGKIRALGVSGLKRLAAIPEVPTIAESGLPGYSSIGWYGVYAPAAISPELVRRIYSEAAAALGSPEMKERLAQSGNEYLMSTPEEFAGFLRDEIAKWTNVVNEAGIRID